MAEDRKFTYVCSNGHEMVSAYEQKKCLVISKGSPCKGTLTRTGRGSKTKA